MVVPVATVNRTPACASWKRHSSIWTSLHASVSSIPLPVNVVVIAVSSTWHRTTVRLSAPAVVRRLAILAVAPVCAKRSPSRCTYDALTVMHATVPAHEIVYPLRGCLTGHTILTLATSAATVAVTVSDPPGLQTIVSPAATFVSA